VKRLGAIIASRYEVMDLAKTAFREITDLVEKKVLVQNPTKGRNTSYDLNWVVCDEYF
jgi:hypothetical protein